MSIDETVDIDSSDIGGAPTGRPYSFEGPEVDEVERFAGVYRTEELNERKKRGMAHELRESTKRHRRTAMMLTGVFGVACLGDATGALDPNGLFYMVSGGSAALAELRSRAERAWSNVGQELSELEQEMETMKEQVREFSREAKRKINLTKAAIDGVRVHSYEEPETPDVHYLPRSIE